MEYHVKVTNHFETWFYALKDRRAKAKITARLLRAQSGNLGDRKAIGDGISEMRITEGKGYRLYYTIRGNTVIFMLIGGDKSTQQADIARARQIKQELSHEQNDNNRI